MSSVTCTRHSVGSSTRPWHGSCFIECREQSQRRQKGEYHADPAVATRSARDTDHSADVARRVALLAGRRVVARRTKEDVMPILLWLLGVPGILIILLMLIGVLHF